MTLRPFVRLGSALLAIAALSACASRDMGGPSGRFAYSDRAARADSATAFPDIGYAAWRDEEPAYRLFPGDELDIAVPTAPELSKTVIVQPDGRVSLPLVGPVMVADRTTLQAQDALDAAYASQLRRPEVYVTVKTAGPLKVFVGGEVDKPGVYDMPGDINSLQAVIQAGGFKTTARREQVVIIRRGGDGRAMMRTVNLKQGLALPGQTDLVPLRRFDIVYVPRTGLASAGVFMQQIKDLIPGNVGFDYAVTNSAKIF
ncbi:MAG TPA: polysaccharide biosynthesis/export family protein [Caulobacteraceae bacterium]